MHPSAMVSSQTAGSCIRLIIPCLALFVMAPELSLAAKQRPFYVIGHMVNSINEVDSFVESGANALEVDVQFAGSGRATEMYHGVPCDCFRVCTRGTPFTEYLDYMRTVTGLDGGKFKGKMTLLVLDLKTSGINEGNQYKAGGDIGRKLIQHLWKNVSPNNTLDVLVSITKPKDKDIFRGVLDAIRDDRNSQHWMKHIGFAFDQFDDPGEIGEVFSQNGIVAHRWLGSGITNCLLHLSRYQLKDIVACRDGRKSGCDYVDKGFTWTLDKESSMAREIKIGLDAVMTNYPKNALAAMRRKDVAPLVRLAGPEDSPWTRVVTDS
ncbi:dermonecrotic toxin StSicTox-betaIC1-like [Haemaphysalis longicornis]